MPQSVGERTLLSTAEACQQSGLSQRHITLLINQGKLEGFKLGRMWHVYEDSLQRFLTIPRKPGPKGQRENPAADFRSPPD